LFTNAELERDWKAYAAKMGDPRTVNWRRDSAIWQGNIIQDDKLITQQSMIRKAYERVLEAIEVTATS
jgi:hypothetical protein